VEPRINLYFKQVIEEMVANGEFDALTRYESLRQFNIHADFQYILIDRVASIDSDFSPYQKFILNTYELIKRMVITEARSLGLDTSNCLVENVPLTTDAQSKKRIIRVN
jgi:KUP system potassium uptake protein